jgi:Predicted nucleotidyltransferases
MRSLYGQRAIESVVSLSQSAGGLTLGELSHVIGGPLSSAQRGIESLAKDHLVIDRRVDSQRRYVINRQHPAGDALVEFSLRLLSPERAIDLILRANPAVQFAGRDHSGYLVVLSPFAEPGDIAQMSEAVDAINGSHSDSIPVEMMERRDVSEQLFDSSELRRRGLRLVPVKGSAVRVFRDPHQHGSFDAPRLGRLHPSLPTPSKRTMKHLARKHGLARVTAFGSSVRSDFRADSDVDVLIEPSAETRLGIRDLLDIRRELESLLDRDVDVVNARAMLAEPLRRAQQEGVLLYGRS